MTTPQHAGYIVFPKASAEAIYAIGPTADEAWQNFKVEMALANVPVLDEGEDSPCDDGGYPYTGLARFENYTIKSASKALLDQVEKQGGAISWDCIGGVCCTIAERESLDDA